MKPSAVCLALLAWTCSSAWMARGADGSGDGTSRALIVVLENYQRADGLIEVPEVLQPLLGKTVIGTR